jgi:acetyl/propionyl-CoA carboxylase alpha subunit
VRVDSGIVEGQDVTAAFDPLLAKLIVCDSDRALAIARGSSALAEFAVLGCVTNIAFLRRLLNSPAFADGAIHTGFLDAHPEIAAFNLPDAETLHKLLAAAALMSRPMREVADQTPDIHASIGSWSN